MCGTGEKSADLVVAQSVLSPDFLPDVFIAVLCQRKINAIERHPVDAPLPVAPSPEGHRVTKRAVIEEETIFHGGRPVNQIGRDRQRFGNCHRVVDVPRNRRQRIVLEVIIERDRQRQLRISTEENLAVFAADFERIYLPRGSGNDFENKIIGMPRRDSLDQPAHRREVICGIGCCRAREQTAENSKTEPTV